MLTYLSIFCFFIAVISTGDCHSFRNCSYHGKLYDFGEHFMDNCKSCECTEGGIVLCMGIADCSEPYVCHHNGTAYKAGEKFPAPTGECTCTYDRGIICSVNKKVH
uniref:NP2 n=1 Tax=Hapalochlaena maculosa TaxID=61716 RepID=B6Z1Z0_HAPMA|nr:NP2 [Hapalochlaena maculosa]